MPRPIYIIVARGVSEDRNTGLATLFGVMETLTATIAAESIPDPVPDRLWAPQSQMCVAVWKKEEGDEGELEHELLIHYPTITDVGDQRTFRFEDGKDMYRFIARMEQFPVPLTDCTVEFESRVRRPGGDWVSQKFPLRLRVVIKAADEPEKPQT